MDRGKIAEGTEATAGSQQQLEENTGAPPLTPLMSEGTGGDEGREIAGMVKEGVTEGVEQPMASTESPGEPLQHTQSIPTT